MPLSALGSSAARTRTIATSFTLNAYSCMGPDFGPALTHHPLVRIERHVVQNNGQLNSLWRDSPGMRPAAPLTSSLGLLLGKDRQQALVKQRFVCKFMWCMELGPQLGG